MRTVFCPIAALPGLMFAGAPCMVSQAPYESTMGLVQKIFYFHMPSWFAMFTAIGICGVASLVHLFTTSPKADRIAEAADIPIVHVWFDYTRNEVGIGTPIRPSGDMRTDSAVLQAHYRPEMAKDPRGFWISSPRDKPGLVA